MFAGRKQFWGIFDQYNPLLLAIQIYQYHSEPIHGLVSVHVTSQSINSDSLVHIRPLTDFLYLKASEPLHKIKKIILKLYLRFLEVFKSAQWK